MRSNYGYFKLCYPSTASYDEVEQTIERMIAEAPSAIPERVVQGSIHVVDSDDVPKRILHNDPQPEGTSELWFRYEVRK